MKEFQENGGQMKFLKENMEKLKKGKGVTLAFTSLCRFPIYEADFGWGKPVWHYNKAGFLQGSKPLKKKY